MVSELISFFDSLNLINWKSTSYSKGFDTNPFVTWDKDIFDCYSNKVNSEVGITNVSSLISDRTLLFNNFKWD